MNCTYHIQNPIAAICIDPHKCQSQRKLCFECVYNHGVDIKNTVPILKFQEIAIQKLQESKLNQSSDLTKQRTALKSMLAQTEIMLKTILEELSESIKQILDLIQIQDTQYCSIKYNNNKLIELSNTDLEMLVQVVQGNNLNYWNNEKNTSLIKLEKTKIRCEQEISAFSEKLNKEMKEILQLINKQSNQVEKEDQKSSVCSIQQEEDEMKLNLNMQELKKLEGHSGHVYSVCFSPNGKLLASCNEKDYDSLFFKNSTIRLWDIKKGKSKVKMDGHRDSVWSVCFSSDGTTLASCSNDKSIRLWDVKTGQQKAKLDGHSDRVWSVCFSPDGTTLASGSNDQSIRLWDVKTGQQKAKFYGHEYSVNSVCFSPDGTALASCGNDSLIRLWDSNTGQQKTKLDGHEYSINSVCFSPDGTALASCGNDNSIRLWDEKRGQQIAKLNGHSDYVQSVCFSPDGTNLASGSRDNSIRLWDAKTGQQKAKLSGHSDWVQSVCFSPDGTNLASGSRDNTIRQWGPKIIKG
ncbi:unnamed protein product [Paramecium sonneborni]|uniref:WD-40 repeat protein n=1 Tax=Paramecium sonneborni TaxID=65129 RepID=A0A8S1NCV6_9CILI|nr:unnamed protein product [Paramecium sonneborni]